MDMVNVKINGMDVQAPKGSTILEAARLANVNIPTLCYLKEINAIAACRICVCEVKGARAYATACVHPIEEGMVIETKSPKIRAARKTTLEHILSNHRRECLSCVRSRSCAVQNLSQANG